MSERTEFANALWGLRHDKMVEKIQSLTTERDALRDMLDEVVNRDVYSYLPQKKGVMIAMSFDDLEQARKLVKG